MTTFCYCKICNAIRYQGEFVYVVHDVLTHQTHPHCSEACANQTKTAILNELERLTQMASCHEIRKVTVEGEKNKGE